jgi:hypothetical protein
VRPETGFYAMGSWGTEPGRVAAIARHIPDAAVYVYGRSNIRNLFGHHGVSTVVPRCGTPGCVGLSARALAAWVRDRDPARLVMDGDPYGVLDNESKNYVGRRSQPTFYVHHRRNDPPEFDPNLFTAVLKVDPEPAIPAIDFHPILPFDDTELPTRAEARNRLGAGSKPMVIIIGEGTTPKYSEFVIRHCDQRGVDHVIINTYPVMPFMPGADLVVGYCGFSQVQAEAVGVPMAGITNMAGPRSWRSNTTPNDLAHMIATLTVRDAPERVTYTNNSRRAAALIVGDPKWETVDG